MTPRFNRVASLRKSAWHQGVARLPGPRPRGLETGTLRAPAGVAPGFRVIVLLGAGVGHCADSALGEEAVWLQAEEQQPARARHRSGAVLSHQLGVDQQAQPRARSLRSENKHGTAPAKSTGPSPVGTCSQ